MARQAAWAAAHQGQMPGQLGTQESFQLGGGGGNAAVLLVLVLVLVVVVGARGGYNRRRSI